MERMQRETSRRPALVTAAIVAACVTWSVLAAAAEKKKEKPKSLYERLGGLPAIAVVVDEFIDVVVADPVLNANPAIDEARKRVPAAYLKFQVTALVCQVTGGPCHYTGRSMKEAHKHLAIGEKEWAALAADFKQVLDKYKVPAKEQEELFAIVGSTKADIVTQK